MLTGKYKKNQFHPKNSKVLRIESISDAVFFVLQTGPTRQASAKHRSVSGVWGLGFLNVRYHETNSHVQFVVFSLADFFKDFVKTIGMPRTFHCPSGSPEHPRSAERACSAVC